MKTIAVEEILKKLRKSKYLRGDVHVLYGEDYLGNLVDSPRVQRPGLALAGFYHHLRSGRVQLLGETEFLYMQTISTEQAADTLSKIAEINGCAFILANNMPLSAEVREAAEAYKMPVISINATTQAINNALEALLDEALAPEFTLHGVCMEVYGIGIVITGASGIGKSECALELIKRGHKLVSDDDVLLKRCMNEIIAYSDDMLHNYVELRGIGVLNITNMFGLTAVCPRKNVEMFIDFINYDEWNLEYSGDRIGLDNRCRNILGLELPQILCPVSPGRNMSEIVELAVKNQMMKQMGCDSALEFTKAVATKIKEKQQL
jgi:HPr kinase/phosphorylase